MNFTKTIRILLPAFFLLTGGIAAPVSLQDAQEVALHWMTAKTGRRYQIKKQSYMYENTKDGAVRQSISAASNYAIVKFESKGWAIVSLDDSTRPIFAYGDSEMGQELPPAMLDWLYGIDQYIERTKKHPIGKKYEQVWERLRQPSEPTQQSYSSTIDDFDYVVRPLLWLDSRSNTEEQGIRWNQGRYYNSDCPTDSDNYSGHALVGCVATAMGQLMRYYKYPTVGTGEHSYTPTSHPEYGEQTADFGSSAYNWESMPLVLDSENDEVARILYHTGVSVDMDYGPQTSRAGGAARSLKKYFGYKLSIPYLIRENFDNDEWQRIIKNELDESRPLYYLGYQEDGGHAFNIDGYDIDGFYHFNWGHGGRENGKFTLDNNSYPLNQYMSIIAPTDPSPQILIEDDNFKSCIIDELDLLDSSEIRELPIKYYTSSLNCSEKSISSISGLEKFLLLSWGLILQNNRLSGKLDLSNQKYLKYIYVQNNQLTSVDLSGLHKIGYFYAYDNKLNTIILPKNAYFSTVDIHNNPINILEIENLKNITSLFAYNTTPLECWQINSLKAENNITNLYTDCSSSNSDNLDTDGDGIKNIDDIDDDNDGINDLEDDDIDGDSVLNSDDVFPLNTDENTDTDNDGTGNNADTDDDNDRMSDAYEEYYGLNPLDASDADQDADGDGYSNLEEYLNESNPIDQVSVSSCRVQGNYTCKSFKEKTHAIDLYLDGMICVEGKRLKQGTTDQCILDGTKDSTAISYLPQPVCADGEILKQGTEHCE